MELTPGARRHDYRTELLLVLVVVIWAANYPLAKYGMRALTPLLFNAIRYVVATLVLSVPFLGGVRWQKVDPKDRPGLLRAGVVASIVYQMAFIIGLNMTTAGNSAILLSTSPLWTILLGARLHGDRIPGSVWAGMAVSFCGITMIIVGSGRTLSFGGTELPGDLITLGAAVLWGLNNNLQKSLLVRYSANQLALIMVGVGAVGLSLFALPTAIVFDWGRIHWSYLAAAILSGILSIAIANLIWSYGVQRIGPRRTANFNNLVPVLAMTISSLTLGEPLLLVQIAGAAVTLLGVWFARRL